MKTLDTTMKNPDLAFYDHEWGDLRGEAWAEADTVRLAGQGSYALGQHEQQAPPARPTERELRLASLICRGLIAYAIFAILLLIVRNLPGLRSLPWP